ncbi:RNA methyltransferase [Taibaiella koreensis]|uniref:RNA methyltransferase n=1 Tax=Taibaiella koreensis TaxID=1268548 RepID=UPI000E59DFE7|nr:RNA methyltransferase [Taibaiella koreensis]
MTELNRAQPGDPAAASRFPVQVVLDDVRSMHNVGSTFRSGDAFHVQGITLCGYTPRPPHRDIHKTALGATETVPWIYEEQITTALERLKADGYRIWAVEQLHNSTSLQDIAFATDEKVALVFGNEVSGVSEAALSLCDGGIEIPQWGAKHSLNISVTVGIVLWEIARRRLV